MQRAHSLGLAFFFLVSVCADHQGIWPDALGHPGVFGIIHLKYYATVLANSFPFYKEL